MPLPPNKKVHNNYKQLQIIVVFSFYLCVPNTVFATERILALAPHACEILYAIGAGKEVVGAVSYCDYPEAAKTLPRVGAYNRINVEAALALKPTMAIVLDTQTPGIKQLEIMGVTIIQSYPKKVAGVLNDIRRIGLLTGHKKQALKLADNLQHRLDKLDVKNSQTPVFYEIWADPLITAGQQTFIHDILKQMGLRNVFGDVPLEAPRVNIEAVIAAQPRVIIVPSEKRNVKKRTLFWRKWLGNDIQVIAVNPDLLHRPGPRLLDGMEYLNKALHPELSLEH
ncbi:MAG: cobalamin-binding protein [Ghiorsea sp.]|nr:cobalamin-binding protein [Ghiorsea sp.]